jgi:AbrB family looped-hinge helix DNA binding protein
MSVTLTEKGQITIPLAVRKRLGLKPGMRLVFDETVPYLKATREVNVADMRVALGCLRTQAQPELRNKSSAEIMLWLRGPEAQ